MVTVEWVCVTPVSPEEGRGLSPSALVTVQGSSFVLQEWLTPERELYRQVLATAPCCGFMAGLPRSASCGECPPLAGARYWLCGEEGGAVREWLYSWLVERAMDPLSAVVVAGELEAVAVQAQAPSGLPQLSEELTMLTLQRRVCAKA